MAARDHGRHVHGTDHVVLGEDKFGGDNVLAHEPHMLPRRCRLQDLDLGLGYLFHVLDHDHGIKAIGHGVAGIDRDCLSGDLETAWVWSLHAPKVSMNLTA